MSCQIPYLTSLDQIYQFIWGYKTDGTFVEVRTPRCWTTDPVDDDINNDVLVFCGRGDETDLPGGRV